MTVLNILKYPNENLKKKALPVNEITYDIISLITNMIDTMILNNGIGLAATQVNIQKRIIVININTKATPLVIINPVILNKQGSTIEKEGCLSFPDIFVKVKRNKLIKISFLDITGKITTLLADNLLSVCIQHEIDHLNGITLYDKMSNLKKKLVEKIIK